MLETFFLVLIFSGGLGWFWTYLFGIRRPFRISCPFSFPLRGVLASELLLFVVLARLVGFESSASRAVFDRAKGVVQLSTLDLRGKKPSKKREKCLQIWDRFKNVTYFSCLLIWFWSVEYCKYTSCWICRFVLLRIYPSSNSAGFNKYRTLGASHKMSFFGFA